MQVTQKKQRMIERTGSPAQIRSRLHQISLSICYLSLQDRLSLHWAGFHWVLSVSLLVFKCHRSRICGRNSPFFIHDDFSTCLGIFCKQGLTSCVSTYCNLWTIQSENVFFKEQCDDMNILFHGVELIAAKGPSNHSKKDGIKSRWRRISFTTMKLHSGLIFFKPVGKYSRQMFKVDTFLCVSSPFLCVLEII